MVPENFSKKMANFFSHSKACLARVKAAYLDWKLGIKIQSNKRASIEDGSLFGDMRGYAPAFYGRLQKMVRFLSFKKSDVFVDLGCGEGRVIFFLATHLLKKVIGVELDKKLFAIAQGNLKSTKIKKTPIELFNMDAATFDLNDATILYMFNPFGRKTVERVLCNLERSLVKNPRNIQIVYYSPEHKELLNGQSWLAPNGSIENEDCLVWRNKPL